MEAVHTNRRFQRFPLGDRFNFYLGDADMNLTSGSGRDHLYIHGDMNEYAGFGLQTSIEARDLYYQAETKTLSICRSNLTYGRLNLADFDNNDTISLMMSDGKCVDVVLTSLQAPANTQSSNQYWTPTTSVVPSELSLVPNLTNWYQQMQASLTINSAVL